MKKVVKFGGSSLASARQFKKVKAIIDADSSRTYVVPSAPGKRDGSDAKVTDLLYEYYDMVTEGRDYHVIHDLIRNRFDDIIEGLELDFSLDHEFEIIEENFQKGMGRDYAASRGEYLNGLIMSEYLGFPFVDAAEVVCFDENGSFLPEKTNEVMKKRLENMDSVVIPGFYGSMPDGTIRTFSRGGSDITGSLLARAIYADLYENWTDVSGFLVADPKIVEDPVPISTITYKELRELSYMGASVLHEDSIFPVKKEGIPINIRNTNKPDDPGTMIVSSTTKKPHYKITGIAGKKGFCAVNIYKAMMNTEIGFGRKVLEVLEDKQIPFEHIPSGIDTMSVLVHQKEFQEKEQAVISGIHRSVHPDSICLESDLALVAVVGRGLKSKRGIAGRIFSALAHANINVKTIDQGIEELTVIIGVRDEDFEPAVRAIYDIFIKTEL